MAWLLEFCYILFPVLYTFHYILGYTLTCLYSMGVCYLLAIWKPCLWDLFESYFAQNHIKNSFLSKLEVNRCIYLPHNLEWLIHSFNLFECLNSTRLWKYFNTDLLLEVIYICVYSIFSMLKAIYYSYVSLLLASVKLFLALSLQKRIFRYVQFTQGRTKQIIFLP